MFKRRKKEINGLIEKLVIEKLTQLENGDLDDCPAGKKLAELMSKKDWCLEIYKNHKKLK